MSPNIEVERVKPVKKGNMGLLSRRTHLITLTSITIVSHTYAEAPSDPRKRVEYEHVSAKVFAIDLKGFYAFRALLAHFVPQHIITMLR